MNYFTAAKIVSMKKAYLLLALCIACFGNAAFAQTLMQAVDKNDTMLALSLIKAGADVNAPDAQGVAPLLKACRWNYVGMVKLLLNNGATVDKPRSKAGRTALMVGAAYSAGITVAKILVEHGADVNAKATDGTTALMLAAKYSKSETVEYLLAHGADATAFDIQGKNALDYAQIATTRIDPAELPDCRIDKADCIARLSKALGK